MKCINCGKKIHRKDYICNYCGAEVGTAVKKSKERTPRKKADRHSLALVFAPVFIGLLLTAALFSAVLMPILLIPIVLVGAVFGRTLWEKFKKGTGYVPDKDNIEKCNRCGSTNIKLYRKGYNYKVGFWGAIFGVRGAGYAGGFDANHTCCRCMDCGKDWETDYDYRLINK